jgi:hypothetical protein
MNQSKKKAILFSKRQELLEFDINGSYVCISEPYTPLPCCMTSFLSFLTTRIHQLVLSIQSNYVDPGYSAAMQILRHDPKFVQA